MINKQEVSVRGSENRSVAVIGGGLAGLAAALEARRKGKRVVLFERSRFLGGRTSSILLKKRSEEVKNKNADSSGENIECLIDNGQHLFLGCCETLRQFNRQLNLDSCFDRSAQITFLQPNGKTWSLRPSGWLPLRWQYLPAFMAIPFLSFSQRMNVIRMCRLLKKEMVNVHLPDRSFREWLDAHGALPETILRFWNPIIVSAFAELPDYVSTRAAWQIIQEGFFHFRDGMTTFIPNRPLREIYHQEAMKSLDAAGIEVRCLQRVNRITLNDEEMPVGLELSRGEACSFDQFIIALGPFATASLLAESGLTTELDRIGFDRFELGAITAVHLWLDRRLMEEINVFLPGEPGQWLFCPKNQKAFFGRDNSVYHQVIISGSHRLLDGEELTARKERQLVDRIVEQLRQSVLTAKGAKVLDYKVSTVLDAVVSPSPDIWSNRPGQKTGLSNLAIAGDWTQTGWSSTMEGAVRSGTAAAEILD